METRRSSALEFRRLDDGVRGLDFIVNGRPLRESIPWVAVLINSLHGKELTPEECEEFAPSGARPWTGLPARLGYFVHKSGKEWREALAQLLMEKPSVGEDGGCPLFACSPGCLCEYVSARIERKDGLFLWRHFAYFNQVARYYQELDLGPFYFEKKSYMERLEQAKGELTAMVDG
jgi:hypothetical protein